MSGSSPQVRGTPNKQLPRRIVRRFIPAGTGNSSMRGSKTWLFPVHPRRYGELFWVLGIEHNHAGSSPQVRGTHGYLESIRHINRFIPAGTGNSGCKIYKPIKNSVHPRRYGELTTGSSTSVLSPGSSPQVRGTPIGHGAVHPNQRFIPAGTGNSSWQLASMVFLSVHPRRYGELQHALFLRVGIGGSSPQVRGTRSLRVGEVANKRFIPAGTGNSSSSNVTVTGQPVHPRRYGELRAYRQRSNPWCGSSPQVRGTRHIHQG